MADDPNSTGQDRRTVPSHRHEQGSLAAKFSEEFPSIPAEAIGYAIRKAKEDAATSEDPEYIENKVREILGGEP